MLALGRKKDQVVHVPLNRAVLKRLLELSESEEIVLDVTVMAIRGDRVRLGFTAPNCIPILRHEVCKRIEDQGETWKDRTS